MKFNVVGVKRIEGLAKATGNPFDMVRLFCLVPIETGGAKTKVSGYGSEVAEMELSAEALASFSAVPFKDGPQVLELQIEQKFVFGEFRSVVVGYTASPGVRKVAG